MALEIRKAERHRAKARIGLCAPSGGGKTHSGLLLANGLGQKIALIDTENGSGELEAGKPNIPSYDVVTITAPFEPQKYINAIYELGKLGYDVIVIDSLSHAWAGQGGLLEQQGTAAERTKNTYTAWREVTPFHNKLIDAMLQAPCHVIATMRSKTDYVLETNDRGKQQPRKVGLAPVQREGMDYEFTIVFDIDQATHQATVSKDRTSLFDGQLPHKISRETGAKILEWLNSGAEQISQPAPQQATPAPQAQTAQAPQTAPAPNLTWDKTPEGLDIIDSFRLLVRVLSTDQQSAYERTFMKSANLTEAQAAFDRAKAKLIEMGKISAWIDTAEGSDLIESCKQLTSDLALDDQAAQMAYLRGALDMQDALNRYNNVKLKIETKGAAA